MTRRSNKRRRTTSSGLGTANANKRAKGEALTMEEHDAPATNNESESEHEENASDQEDVPPTVVSDARPKSSQPKKYPLYDDTDSESTKTDVDSVETEVDKRAPGASSSGRPQRRLKPVTQDTHDEEHGESPNIPSASHPGNALTLVHPESALVLDLNPADTNNPSERPTTITSDISDLDSSSTSEDSDDLDYELSENGEDAGSSDATPRPRKRKGKPTLGLGKETLSSAPANFAAFFNDIRIPYHPDVVIKEPRRSSKNLGTQLETDAGEDVQATDAKKKKRHYTASTVPRSVLITNGGWAFTSYHSWANKGWKIKAPEVHKPLRDGGGDVSLTVPPISGQLEEATEPLDKINASIVDALKRAKNTFESDKKALLLPEEWLKESKEDIGSRPEMPVRFKPFLSANRHERKREDHNRNSNPDHNEDAQDPSIQTIEEGDSSIALPSPNSEAGATEYTTPDSQGDAPSPHTPGNMQGEPSPSVFIVRKGQYQREKTPVGMSQAQGGSRASTVSPIVRHVTKRSKISIQFRDDQNHRLHSPIEEEAVITSNNIVNAMTTLLPPEGPVEHLAASLGLDHDSPTAYEAQTFENHFLLILREWKRKSAKKKLCDLLESLQANPFSSSTSLPVKVAYVPKSTIEDKDGRNRSGHSFLNENAKDVRNTEMAIIYKWAQFDGIVGRNNGSYEDEEYSGYPRTEGSVEKQVGDLFHGLFSLDGIVTRDNAPLRFIAPLTLIGTVASPDFAARACGDDWADWGGRLAPCIFTAECKTEDTITEDCEAQLAMSTWSTLVILLIIHLDTRVETSDPLPAWMWLYSIIYTEYGLTIYAHYPAIRTTDDEVGWSWSFVSCRLTDKFERVWKEENSAPHQLVRALHNLFKVRSHNLFVVDQIKSWAKTRGRYGEGIMDKFIWWSHVESNNQEWLRAEERKMASGKKKAVKP